MEKAEAGEDEDGEAAAESNGAGASNGHRRLEVMEVRLGALQSR